MINTVLTAVLGATLIIALIFLARPYSRKRVSGSFFSFVTFSLLLAKRGHRFRPEINVAETRELSSPPACTSRTSSAACRS
jgi:hypothetical protein